MTLCQFCVKNKPGTPEDCGVKRLVNTYTSTLGTRVIIDECVHYEPSENTINWFTADGHPAGESE